MRTGEKPLSTLAEIADPEHLAALRATLR